MADVSGAPERPGRTGAPSSGKVVANSHHLAEAFRQHNATALATLIRVLGDFDLAEDALQEAWIQASTHWGDCPPANVVAWLVTTARRKALDRLRRDAVGKRKLAEAAREAPLAAEDEVSLDAESIRDDRLRLIFTCCHPALTLETRVALTLRTLGGLTTAEIARAFVTDETTVAQRIVRAKRKIRDAGIPYRVPESEELPERLPSVLAVSYLVFNEGYSSTSSERLVRGDLCREAIRLSRQLAELMPAEPEVLGLLALQLLHDSRREARQTESGDMILLDDQDRSLWDAAEIREGSSLVERALSMGRPGPYQVQAAIAAVHAGAASPADTRWGEIAELYSALIHFMPTPVVFLNRAVAYAMADGPEVGLRLMDEIPDLDGYHLFHSARADLLRRLGRAEESGVAYRRALELATNPVERRFLERRLAELAWGMG
jgi:RNA polymerase sigma-70 factor (ECF subfamily)